jgi:hypothetical protein
MDFDVIRVREGFVDLSSVLKGVSGRRLIVLSTIRGENGQIPAFQKPLSMLSFVNNSSQASRKIGKKVRFVILI